MATPEDTIPALETRQAEHLSVARNMTDEAARAAPELIAQASLWKEGRLGAVTAQPSQDARLVQAPTASRLASDDAFRAPDGGGPLATMNELNGQIDTLQAQLNATFDTLNTALVAKVYAEALPLVGAQLATVFTSLNQLGAIQAAFNNALDQFQADATPTQGELNALIDAALTPYGLADYAALINGTFNAGDNSIGLSVNVTKSADNASVALDSDLGFSGFNFNTAGNVVADASFAFNLAVGLSGASTPVFSITSGNELSLSFDVSAPNFTANAGMGFLQFSATDLGSTVTGGMTVNVDGTGANASAAITGAADIGLRLAAVANVPGMPNIGADLNIDWSFSGALDGSGATFLGSKPAMGLSNVTYDLGSFLTEFVQPILANLNPVLEPLKQALAVLNTELGFLSIVPGLAEELESTGDDRITLLDFAAYLDIPGFDLDTVLQVIEITEDVLEWAALLQGLTPDAFGPDAYDLGDYAIVADIRDGANLVSNLLAEGIELTDIANQGNLLTFIGGLGGSWNDEIDGASPSARGTGGPLQANGGESGKSLLQQMVLGAAFEFPILTDPTQVFKMLLGQNADLFKLDLQPITFDWGSIDEDGNPTDLVNFLTLPILPGVTLDFAAGFNVAIDMAFGFDSRGLQMFAQGGYNTAEAYKILNGFYLDDQDDGTTDLPEITLAAALEIAVHASILGAGVAGAGNISGQLFVDLSDALVGNDGRIYLDEMGNALTGGDPFSLFDVSGRITAGLSAYVTAPLVGTVWRYNSGRITLAEFSTGHEPPIGSTPPPDPMLAEQTNATTLTLNVGARAGLRDIDGDGVLDGAPDADETGESVGVAAYGGGLQVVGYNKSDHTFNGVSLIVADGGDGDDELFLSEGLGVAASLTGGAGSDFLYGGAGADTLKGGQDRDYAEGGEGADSILGEGGDDVLEGRQGADTLDGGLGGFDIATYEHSASAVYIDVKNSVYLGDAAGDVLIEIEAVEGTNFAAGDTMKGGATNEIFFGLQGADSLVGGAGADILVGGLGADTLEGGGGIDSASYIGAAGGVVVSASVGTGGEAIGDVLSGFEQIEGSQYADRLIAGTDAITLIGQFGADTLDGGGADDILDGGEGADQLNGGGGSDTARYRSAGQAVVVNLASGGTGGDALGDSYNLVERVDASDHSDSVTGDGAVNTLYGWDGADTLRGMGSVDLLHGGAGTDTLEGGTHDDTLVGGDGGDRMDGGDGTDTATYRYSLNTVSVDLGAVTVGGDALGDSFFAVEIIEGSDLTGLTDSLRGDTNANTFRGLKGNDSLFGAAGADTLIGNAGADTLDGGTSGSDRDWVTYLTAAGGIVLNLKNGVASNDGDGGSDTVSNVEDAVGSLFNDSMTAGTLLGGSRLEGRAGADTLNGASASDTLEGGAGNDSLVGAGGVDYASYRDETAGVTASLTSNSATGTSSGADTFAQLEGLIGSTSADSLTGSANADTLIGNAGNDTLDGAGSADSLEGGEGDDTYRVDALADVVHETGSSGADRTVTSVNYADAHHLESNVEQLELVGAARVGFGNGVNNLMLGTTGDDTLNGLGGSDDMRGGGGNDVYDFDLFSDLVVENAGAGTDHIRLSTVSAPITGPIPIPTFSLSAAWAVNIENLTLTDDARAVHLVGNTLNNRLVGNDFAQLLQGLDGDDVLNPDMGRDAVEGAAGFDTLQLDWSSVAYEVSTYVFNDVAGVYDGNIRNNYNGSDTNRVDFTGVERFDIRTGNQGDSIRTGDSYDFVALGDGGDFVRSGKGADTIDGGANAGGYDVWASDQRDAIAKMTIDLTQTTSTWSVFGRTGSVTGIEALGRVADGDHFVSGSGDDAITTLGGFYVDVVESGLGGDTVKVAGGRDIVFMGGNTANKLDTLVVDWSASAVELSTYEWGGDLASGYAGHMRNNYNSADTNRVDFTGVERFDIKTGNQGESIRTGDSYDAVASGDGADFINSGKGADTIDGGANPATVADRWASDQADATTAMVIDLTAAVSTWQVGTRTGSVTGIEALGRAVLGETFRTGSGADVITTLGGFFVDFIETNDGADTVKVAGGRDTVWMGAQPAGAADTLVVDWSASAVELSSYGWGGDLASGYAGDMRNNYNSADTNRVDFTGVERFDIKTGSEGDSLRTGDSNDAVASGAGADFINSGKGADTIDGGANPATVADRWASDQSDATTAMVIDLTAAVSTWQVGTRTGSVTGIEALGRAVLGETFRTGAGADVITTLGGFFVDFVETNDGDDTVKVAGGRDTVWMGAQPGGATDTLVLDWSNVLYEVSTYGWSGSLAAGYAGDMRNNYNGADTNRVDFTGVERFDIRTGAQGDRIVTGDGDDAVVTGDGDDVLNTARGVDRVDGGGGLADRWIADKSFATASQAILVDLTKAFQSTYLTTGTVRGIEAVQLLTGAGDDVVTTLGTQFLSDTVNTGAGVDIVTIAAGRDSVDLGANPKGAVDTLIINWSSIDYEVSNYIWDATATLNTGYTGQIRNNYNSSGTNLVDFTGVERFDIRTGSAGDYLITGDGADYVNGGAGNDVLSTGRGIDSVEGGLGDDWWIADKAFATDAMAINVQKAAPQTYLVDGYVRGVERLSLTTGSGADDITTGTGFLSDSITTRAGNDKVVVAGGRDFVDMGAAGAGGDRLIVSWASADQGFALYMGPVDATGYSGIIRDNYNSANRVDFVGVDRFSITLGAGADNITTGDGADILAGGAGNDLLAAAGGADKLFGEDGLDALNGGDGDDNLVGGAGQDTMNGGLGKDTFSFSSLGESTVAAADRIDDLEDLIDRIDLKGLDANTNVAGDQKFALAAAFTGVAGQLVVSPYDGTRTLVQGDVDGDGAADFAIALAGDHDSFTRFVL